MQAVPLGLDELQAEIFLEQVHARASQASNLQRKLCTASLQHVNCAIGFASLTALQFSSWSKNVAAELLKAPPAAGRY